MILRPYQLRCVEDLRAAFARGSKAVCLALPTGAGKTVIAAEMVRKAVAKGRQVLLLVHRIELVDQAVARLEAFGVPSGVIAAGRDTANHPVQVASVQTLARRDLPDAQLVFIDECFPSGTLVEGRRIEDLRVGDVLSTGTVTWTMRSRPAHMVRLYTDSGEIECTELHPFWTEDGWIPAGMLDGHRVMRYTTQHEDVPVVPCGDRLDEEGELLQQGVQAKTHCQKAGRLEQKARWGADASQQPHEGSTDKGAYVCVTESAWWMGTKGSWRERTEASGSTGFVGRNTWLGDGSRYQNRSSEIRKNISDVLQGGHRKPGCEDRRRGGRQEPLLPKGVRREEGQVPFWSWVDRVEVLQQTSDGTFGGVCPDGFVYNVEVEGSNAYWANGFLVHNCHHAVADTYKRILEGYPKAWIVGLSATPARLDGRPLSDVFDALVLGPSTQELVNEGVLLEPVIYSHPSIPDLRGLKTTLGDYALGDLARRACDAKLVGDIVEHWRQRALPSSRGVCYAVNVAHSLMMVDEFSNAGIPAVHIDGNSSAIYRAEALELLKRGEISIISNCMVLTEGWDLPELDMAICARPTQSLVLWRQMVGRVMRTAPGKDGCTVLDHAGNANRLGLPTDHVAWTLEGTVKKPTIPAPKSCPECFATMLRSEPVCPECGHVFTVSREPVNLTTAEGSLVRVSKEDRADVYKKFVLEASAKKRKLGWARIRYHEKFGVWPVKQYEAERLYECTGHVWERTKFGTVRCERCLRAADPDADPAGGWKTTGRSAMEAERG